LRKYERSLLGSAKTVVELSGDAEAQAIVCALGDVSKLRGLLKETIRYRLPHKLQKEIEAELEGCEPDD